MQGECTAWQNAAKAGQEQCLILRRLCLQIFEGQVIAIVVPDKVELTVAETTPAIKGAPSSQTKDAVTDTGLSLRVPQFIEEGERILVSTSDGKYSSRA